MITPSDAELADLDRLEAPLALLHEYGVAFVTAPGDVLWHRRSTRSAGCGRARAVAQAPGAIMEQVSVLRCLRERWPMCTSQECTWPGAAEELIAALLDASRAAVVADAARENDDPAALAAAVLRLHALRLELLARSDVTRGAALRARRAEVTVTAWMRALLEQRDSERSGAKAAALAVRRAAAVEEIGLDRSLVRDLGIGSGAALALKRVWADAQRRCLTADKVEAAVAASAATIAAFAGEDPSKVQAGASRLLAHWLEEVDAVAREDSAPCVVLAPVASRGASDGEQDLLTRLRVLCAEAFPSYQAAHSASLCLVPELVAQRFISAQAPGGAAQGISPIAGRCTPEAFPVIAEVYCALFDEHDRRAPAVLWEIARAAAC